MVKIQYRLASCSDPAGKRSDVAPLFGNEDNMLVLPDLKDEAFVPDQVVELGDRGTLLVVADGMGGMNAGEVASAIAVATVKDMFSSGEAAAINVADYHVREAFLEKVVVAADLAIKTKAAADPSCSGMGSTLIMMWICSGEATVSWCGDSRAYLLRSSIGLRQVSKDHSYVQQLVDAGKITMDEAFNHPYGNVITRSLGDASKVAKADSRTFPLYKGDILMLCSDGLSGVLRDSEMQEIMNSSRATLTGCREALWKAAEAAEWYDNVTAVLCEIVDGDEPSVTAPASTRVPVRNTEPAVPRPNQAPRSSKPKGKGYVTIISAFIGVVVAGTIAFLALRSGITHSEGFDTKFDTLMTLAKDNGMEYYEGLLKDIKSSCDASSDMSELKNLERDLELRINTINSLNKISEGLDDKYSGLKEYISGKVDLIVKKNEGWNKDLVADIGKLVNAYKDLESLAKDDKEAESLLKDFLKKEPVEALDAYKAYKKNKGKPAEPVISVPIATIMNTNTPDGSAADKEEVNTQLNPEKTERPEKADTSSAATNNSSVRDSGEGKNSQHAQEGAEQENPEKQENSEKQENTETESK